MVIHGLATVEMYSPIMQVILIDFKATHKLLTGARKSLPCSTPEPDLSSLSQGADCRAQRPDPDRVRAADVPAAAGAGPLQLVQLAGTLRGRRAARLPADLHRADRRRQVR